MTSPISTYSFLPWLRQGVARKIEAADLDLSVRLRADINVGLQIEGRDLDGNTFSPDPIQKTIQVFGPGDIVGIESRAIIKTEPHNWITIFEPNFMGYIDFYDEDFPWRYTPAAPDNTKKRLRPWIALVILKEGEFEEGGNILGKPLPYIKVSDAATKFPPAEQLWAWAHVQVNSDLSASDDEIVSTDTGAILPKFKAVLDEDPDLAYSRILCPRRLEANTAYHAFLMPVYESGRMAGLGIDLFKPGPTADDPLIVKVPYATLSAWADYPADAADPKEEPEHFPFYHRWYFRTGTVGDFEYLIRLLEPKAADKDVGRRDMDTSAPYPGIRGLDPLDDLGGILKLGGALRVPLKTMKKEDKEEFEKYDKWDKDYPDPPEDIQKDTAVFINLNDDYSKEPASNANDKTDLGDIHNDNDPVITPPLYARWHSQTQRLLFKRDGSNVRHRKKWVHKVNLDPRFRVAAGFGTKIVQQNQEKYMNAAWEQVGDVLAANQKIRQGQLAKKVTTSWYKRHVLPMRSARPEKAFTITTPVHKRVVTNGFTVHQHVKTSAVRTAVTTTAARRVVRPGSRLMKSLQFTNKVRRDNLISRINRGDVTAAPPKVVPDSVVKAGNLVDSMLSGTAPGFIVRLLRRYNWAKYLPLVFALILLILMIVAGPSGSWIGVESAIIAALVSLFGPLTALSRHVERADAIRVENQTPEAVDRLPKSPDFKLTQPGDTFMPRAGRSDSPEAIRFKKALRESNGLLVAGVAASTALHADTQPQLDHVLDLPAITNATVDAIDPTLTIPRRVLYNIKRPDRLIRTTREGFRQVMAYPEFDTPMYKPLVDLSAELFLPNIDKVEQNSITLLETNQAFIESYMVGLNHEFARELLWREYPTDQRGSYYRQFWDVSSYLDTKNTDPDELRGKLRDIPPIHKWKKRSKLGDHDHREQVGTKEEELVLVIRGELLKKYPTAVIYAHRAQWKYKDGKIDNSEARELVVLTAEEENVPPKSKVKTPLYKAVAEPDIFFFGFDLVADEARGGTGEDPKDDPGWFFVIKERPGEARFGADVAGNDFDRDANPIVVWNDLAWPDILPNDEPGAHIPVDESMLSPVIPPWGQAYDDEKLLQWEDDRHVQWNEDSSAADIAYILYQAPMMVAVHAVEMLPRQEVTS